MTLRRTLAHVLRHAVCELRRMVKISAGACGKESVSMKKIAPLLIAPECSAPGCHRNGDQALMIKCRGCDLWFCEEHIEPLGNDAPDAPDGAAEGIVSERLASVPTVKRIDTGLHGLTYYLGECQACRERREQSAGRRSVDSSWLR